MIKAKPHQQQPANAVECEHCGERFNNKGRLYHHKDRVYSTYIAPQQENND